MDYTIRPAALDDANAIAEVARYTWDVTYAHSVGAHNRRKFLKQAYAPEALYEAIAHDRGWFYVAIWTGTVVGFAQYLRRFDAQGELVRIYVHPDHQRCGVGRAFLRTGLTAMAATGVTLCYASVEVNNSAARAFYERFGFRRHREYGRFLGDQIIRLVEYVVPIAICLKRLTLKK
ncbi:MAG: GNAT family N-acetyltransferase [Anaerolineae bacterium]|jgi:ribosomal protein S18 acetylase RimI-like enzyme